MNWVGSTLRTRHKVSKFLPSSRHHFGHSLFFFFLNPYKHWYHFKLLLKYKRWKPWKAMSFRWQTLRHSSLPKLVKRTSWPKSTGILPGGGNIFELFLSSWLMTNKAISANFYLLLCFSLVYKELIYHWSKIFWGFYLSYGCENTVISSAFLIRVKDLSRRPFIINVDIIKGSQF